MLCVLFIRNAIDKALHHYVSEKKNLLFLDEKKININK